MTDNYEPDENVNPCENCNSRFNGERCRTCKHRYKSKPLRPQYPNTTDTKYKILTRTQK